jgi:hypothetical protein
MEKLKGTTLFLLITILIVLVSHPQLANAEKRELSLKTDKSIYHRSENVTVILTNNGDETVFIGGYPAWQISTYPEGESVFPEVFAFLAWSLAPGESNISIWNQCNQLVEPGTYIVKDTQGWGLSAIFEIVPETAPEFSSNIALAVFMMFSMLILILAKKNSRKP